MDNDLPAQACRSCGAICRTVPLQARGGDVEVGGYYCEAEGCNMNGRDQHRLGEPGLCETEFRADGSARFSAFGRPSQGEQNTLPTCEAFVDVLRRDFGVAVGPVESVEVHEDRRVDGRAVLPGAGWLNLQVTRALPGEDYRAQAGAGEVERVRAAAESVELLRCAIDKKREGARHDITFLIDGRGPVDLALWAPIEFARDHGRWAREQGWESIWVVGPTFATPLDREPEGPLPERWSASISGGSAQ